MKPFRAFLFVTSVLILIFLISFIESKRGQEYLFGQARDFANGPTTETDSAFQSEPEQLPDSLASDSTLSSNSTDSIKPHLAFQPTIPNGSGLIFPPGDTLRLQALSNLLQNAASGHRQVRILYYGDSQIESDHVTSTLRKNLQQRFGGHGPGLIAPDKYYNPAHQLVMTLSDNWQVWLPKDQSCQNRSIIFRNALAVQNDEQVWFRINRLRSLRVEEDYQQVRLFLYSNESSRVELLNSAKPVMEEQIDSTRQICAVSENFKRTPDDLKMAITPNDSLYVTGISLESPSGVFVDNIALRGLSYPPFSQSDKQSLNQMFGQLHPGMFILQFGVNVVPYQNGDPKYFKSQFNRQVRWLRQSFPDTPILVIGVSDMAHKVDGEFVSYENIHRIKQIQYEVAMTNQCLFWDLEQYMGGPGSMIQWVDNIPALGRKDYVHFSEKGAERIGNELSKLIIDELQTNRLTAWKSN